MEEKKSPLDVDRTPSARLRVERSMSASVRGETAVTLEGYEFEGTLGYGAFARVLNTTSGRGGRPSRARRWMACSIELAAPIGTRRRHTYLRRRRSCWTGY